MLKYILILFFSISLLSSERPNIIIIITDDLGWGDVSYNGGPINTPNIDKLAHDGLQMNRFYSAPTCSPTRAALFTGINSLKNGIIRPLNNPTAERYGLPLKHKILPEYLKEIGYQTALSGKWHLGMFSDEYLPRNRGFESTYGHLGGGIGYFDHALSGRLDWHRNGEILYEDGYSTTLIADEAIRIIENKNNETPLFLYVAFNAPHTPIQAEEKIINNLDNQKTLTSNGRYVVIKTNDSHYIYNIQKTPLNLILDKNFILEKIRKVEGKTLDGKFINFTFLEKENKINLFFSKSNYDLVGWQSIDIYQNLSITFISSIIKNIEINENLFKLPIQD